MPIVTGISGWGPCIECGGQTVLYKCVRCGATQLADCTIQTWANTGCYCVHRDSRKAMFEPGPIHRIVVLKPRRIGGRWVMAGRCDACGRFYWSSPPVVVKPINHGS
jgi:hypothetical protein